MSFKRNKTSWMEEWKPSKYLIIRRYKSKMAIFL